MPNSLGLSPEEYRERVRQQRRASYVRNREKIKTQTRASYLRRKPQILAYQKDYYQRNSEKAKARSKRVAFDEKLKRFGMNRFTWQSMFDAQHGCCAICTSPNGNSLGHRLAIDHDHVTGLVRGLLCVRCNIAIGLLDDDPELLARVIQYLRPMKTQAG